MSEQQPERQSADEVAGLVTLHLDEALAHCKRLAELLHNRPTRTALDLEASRFLVYIGWLLERDSNDRKLGVALADGIHQSLARLDRCDATVEAPDTTLVCRRRHGHSGGHSYVGPEYERAIREAEEDER